jgi:glycosyltransferase involved in cell wall biosynthesis
LTKILFVGMLPPESHNSEERRFVQELGRQVHQIRYMRGIGVKGLGLRHIARLISRKRPAAPSVQHTLAIVPLRNRMVRPINVKWLQKQLVAAADGVPRDWVFWTRFPSPELVAAAANIPFREIVYEPIDKYPAAGDFSLSESRRILAAEAQLVEIATVITGARSLAESFRGSAGGSHWLPFGHDVGRASQGAGLPNALRRPRLAVVGELDWRIDDELLARLGWQHPEWTLILVGPRRRNWGSPLQGLKNVLWLGRIPAERVRMVVRDCDVTLIPYRITEWTRACLPVKLFEYLAEGKPVVTVPLPELKPFDDVVTSVPAEQFEAAIAVALRDDDDDAQRRRRQTALRFTLEDRARRAAGLLERQRVAEVVL